MAMSRSQRTTLDNLLNKGDLDGAAKLMRSIAGPEKAGDGAEAEPAKPPEPRKPEAIMIDLFKGIHQLLGNSPALVPLIHELEEVLTPPAPAEAPRGLRTRCT